MNEEDWRQIIFDFRWSSTARGHWIARYGRSKLAALCLRVITLTDSNRFARDLVVFLEENFEELTCATSSAISAAGGSDKGKVAGNGNGNASNNNAASGAAAQANKQKGILFAVCETLNNIIVAPGRDGRPEAEKLKCQAVSSLTVILIQVNAYSQYRKLLLSFVNLLSGVIARARSHNDRQLRLVACESLKLLESEYPFASFVSPKHALSHCETETTHALQGYLVLLAATMCKLVKKITKRDNSSHKTYGTHGKTSRGIATTISEIEEATETLSHYRNEIRQAALLLLDKMELLSPAGALAVSQDFLVLSSCAQIDHHDLWHSFYILLHMSNPLIISEVLLFCLEADYQVREEDYFDVTYALLRRIEHPDLHPIQVCHLVGSALSIPNSKENLYKVLRELSRALMPSFHDNEHVISAKTYACLKICKLCATQTQPQQQGEEKENGKGGKPTGATRHEIELLEAFCRNLQLQIELIISRGSRRVVKPLFNAAKDFLNDHPNSVTARAAYKIMENCFDVHPRIFSVCLDCQLSKILREEGEAVYYKYFLDAVVGFFSKWIPNDYKFVGKDMSLLYHYFGCIEKIFTINTVSPKLLLSALLYYVRCCIPREGNRNWGMLEMILSLVRSVLKHHAINIHSLLDIINELLQTVKDFADDPDTMDHCCFYLSLVNSIDVTKLSLLMFDSDVKVNSKLQLKPKLPRKRNLNPQLVSVQRGKLEVEDRSITDFHIEMSPLESNKFALSNKRLEGTLGEQSTATSLDYGEYESLVSENEFMHKFRCKIVFDNPCDLREGDNQCQDMYALEISFETSGSGDISFATNQPILVPYVSAKSCGKDCPQTFDLSFKILRPLPLTLNPKVKFTNSDGACYSGHLDPIHVSIEHFCVPFTLERKQDKLLEKLWHALFNKHDRNWISGNNWTLTKTLDVSSSSSKEGSWRKFCILDDEKKEEDEEEKDGDGAGETQSPLLIFLPPKYHIVVLISEGGKWGWTARINTDFWPCLEYIDDYLNSLFHS